MFFWQRNIQDVEEVFAHVTDTTATLAVGFFRFVFGNNLRDMYECGESAF